MMKISKSVAGFVLATAAFVLPSQLAVAGHKAVKTKTTTVTTTTTVTETRTVTKHKHSNKFYIKKPRVRVHKQARKHPSYEVKIKREKLRKPKTKRHTHQIKGYTHQGYRGWKPRRRSAVNHRHGRYLPHTHRQDDFINISPKAKQWPNPRPHSFLLDVLPVPAHVLTDTANAITPSKGVQVAVVVKEESNGVTIIRNVKETRQNGEVVEPDTRIGVTPYPRPVYILSEEELAECERPLRTVGESKDVSVKVGKLTYCE